jgi:hypothetical protein
MPIPEQAVRDIVTRQSFFSIFLKSDIEHLELKKNVSGEEPVEEA